MALTNRQTIRLPGPNGALMVTGVVTLVSGTAWADHGLGSVFAFAHGGVNLTGTAGSTLTMHGTATKGELARGTNTGHLIQSALATDGKEYFVTFFGR